MNKLRLTSQDDTEFSVEIQFMDTTTEEVIKTSVLQYPSQITGDDFFVSEGQYLVIKKVIND